MADAMTPGGRLDAVGRRIAEACTRAGRPNAVTLVAVTKTVGMLDIRAAWEAGQLTFGENRVQEAEAKVEALPEATWHLLGHLQTNKARTAAHLFSMVESVDSLRIARKLSAVAAESGRRLSVLLEVNVAGEESKGGLAPETVPAILAEVMALPGVQVEGLMTVAPLVQDQEDVRWVFRRLRELRDELQQDQGIELPELSMGMSGDFEVAVEEGATIVRIGRAIFGERAVGRTETAWQTS